MEEGIASLKAELAADAKVSDAKVFETKAAENGR